MNKLTFTLLAVLLAFQLNAQEANTTSLEQVPQSLNDPYSRTKALIEEGTFRFVANWGFASGGPRLDLVGNNNYIEVDVDHIHAYLQYFGRVYSDNRSRNAQAGIVMEGGLENWKVEYDDERRSIRYSFTHRNRPDLYDVLIRISASGNASVNIISPNRDPISYEGYIEPLETSK